MKSFPLALQERPSGGGSNVRLTGEGPFYSAPPANGEVITTNLVLSDASDYTSMGATIVSVTHFVLAEQSPGVVQVLSLFDAGLLIAAPGDNLRVRAIVTDSLGGSLTVTSPAVVVLMDAPTVTADPSFTAAVGNTTFVVNFGSADPVGTSPMLGAYAPTLTPTFTINGASRVGELTFTSGSNYTWNGAAIADGDVISASAPWSNIAGTVVSATITQTATAFGFTAQSDGTATLTYGDGVDVSIVVTDPTAYAGTKPFTAASQAAMPHKAQDVVILGAGTRNEGDTLTKQAGMWLVGEASEHTVATEWLRGGAPISGATGSTYIVSGADAGTTITCRETCGGETSTSNGITIASGAKTVTFLFGEANASAATSGTVYPFASDFSGVAAGSTLIIGVSVAANTNGAGLMTATFGGAAAERLDKSNETLSRLKMAFFKVTHPGGSPVFAITITGASTNRAHMAAWRVTGTSGALKTRASFERINGASPGVLDLNTTNGDLVFVVTGGDGANGATQATTGAGTVAYSNTIPTNLTTAQFYGVLAASTGTPRDVDTTWTGNANIAGLAITI